jgi:hypothetical protein
MGQLAGVSVSFMLGFQAPSAFEASAGWARWTALGWAGFTEGYGIAGAIAGLSDGQWQWSDAFNIASLLAPAAAASGSIRGFLGTARSATGNVDDALRSAHQPEVASRKPAPKSWGSAKNPVYDRLTRSKLHHNWLDRHRINSTGTISGLTQGNPVQHIANNLRIV